MAKFAEFESVAFFILLYASLLLCMVSVRISFIVLLRRKSEQAAANEPVVSAERAYGKYLAAAVVVGIAALTTCLLVFSPVTSSSVFFWSQLPYHIVALCWIGFALGCLNASSPRRQSAQTSFCGSLTKRLLSTAGFWIYMDALVPWTKLVRHYNNRPPAQTGY